MQDAGADMSEYMMSGNGGCIIAQCGGGSLANTIALAMLQQDHALHAATRVETAAASPNVTARSTPSTGHGIG